MIKTSIHISENFLKVGTRDIDERNRLCLGNIMNKEYKRYQVFKSDQGEILLRPIVEIPAAEAKLYKKAIVEKVVVSEEALADWNRPQEDKAWAHLQ